MRLYLYVFTCIILLKGCNSGMSGRGPTQFEADNTGAVEPCSGQTSPSPQCPSGSDEPTPTPKPKPNNEEPSGSGDTGDSPPPDTSPTYTNGKLELKVTPWPHKISKDTDTELTLTYTAVTNIERKGKTQHGQVTHNINIGISPYNAVNTYKVKSLSTLEHFKDNRRLRCSIVHNCPIKIVEMKKDESFSVTLTINASQNFSIGYLRKIPDGHNTDLDLKPPQIQVE